MTHLILRGRLTASLSAAFSSSSRILLSSNYSNHSKENETWIESLNDAQKVFHYGTRNGLRITLMRYTLNFRKPIDFEIIYKAVEHLKRVFPPFQCTIRERDGDLWVYRPENVGIDAEVIPRGTSLSDVIDHMTRPFDEVNGPLSRYRFALADEDDPCELPEIRKEFPFQYYLYESLNHCIFDANGHTAMVASLTDILDSMMDGEDLSNAPLCGEYVTHEEYDGIYSQIREELLKNPDRVDYVKGQILKSNKSPILLKVFPRPDVDELATKHISINLDKDVNKNFGVKCKENGVSLGNGFLTSISSSLVELVQDAGAKDDTYDLSMMYSVDLRRYMKKRNLPILGFHTRSVSSCVTLEKNVRDNFWDNSRMIQQANKSLMAGNSIFEQEVVRRHFMPYTAPEDLFKSDMPVTRDFGFNNIGIVKTCGRYKHVMITFIDNYLQAHKFLYPIYTQVLTYGGKPRQTISYATDWVSDDTANSLAEKMKSVLEYQSQR